jgi:hypothetical protein
MDVGLFLFPYPRLKDKNEALLVMDEGKNVIPFRRIRGGGTLPKKV